MNTRRQARSGNLRSIVEWIRPSVEVLLGKELGDDPDALVQRAIRANILPQQTSFAMAQKSLS